LNSHIGSFIVSLHNDYDVSDGFVHLYNPLIPYLLFNVKQFINVSIYVFLSDVYSIINLYCNDFGFFNILLIFILNSLGNENGLVDPLSQ